MEILKTQEYPQAPEDAGGDKDKPSRSEVKMCVINVKSLISRGRRVTHYRMSPISGLYKEIVPQTAIAANCTCAVSVT